jgi:putative transposase
VPWKDKKEVVADLKNICTASNAEKAKKNLNAFHTKWDDRNPTIATSSERNWEGLIPFLSYPDYIRKVIYTTNAIESLNRSLRKVTKNRGSLPPHDELALRNISKKCTMPSNYGSKL